MEQGHLNPRAAAEQRVSAAPSEIVAGKIGKWADKLFKPNGLSAIDLQHLVIRGGQDYLAELLEIVIETKPVHAGEHADDHAQALGAGILEALVRLEGAALEDLQLGNFAGIVVLVPLLARTHKH